MRSLELDHLGQVVQRQGRLLLSGYQNRLVAGYVQAKERDAGPIPEKTEYESWRGVYVKDDQVRAEGPQAPFVGDRGVKSHHIEPLPAAQTRLHGVHEQRVTTEHNRPSFLR